MQDLAWRFEHSYAQLPDCFFSRESPACPRSPRLLIFNDRLASTLGLAAEAVDPENIAAQLGGATLPVGAQPVAQAYAGHQFGHFTMLGDGRALLLGEHHTPDGRRVDIHLKGAGPTAFSRRGDGRAALGPMLREYLISEAMHALGVPTTRSLAVVGTGEPVWRETVLDGAVLTRVAASHLRVGTFQYAAARRDDSALAALVEYALARHDPDRLSAERPALALLDAVVDRQIDLIVHWMRVGFVHGVMNTDNMTISGETIDYGPCAFIDPYDPRAVFSSIDHGGRYAFANQPVIAQWNLARLAESLLTRIDPDPDRAVERAEPVIAEFSERYQARWQSMMTAKIGLSESQGDDGALIDALLAWMTDARADWTLTFTRLAAHLAGQPTDLPETLACQTWLGHWRARASTQSGGIDAALARMRLNNPVYIARNHQVETALEAWVTHGDRRPFERLLEAVSDPYHEREGFAAYAQPPAPSPVPYRTFCGT
jgi:uncharacterized protein YdiU (UPF0061 family)